MILQFVENIHYITIQPKSKIFVLNFDLTLGDYGDYWYECKGCNTILYLDDFARYFHEAASS